MQKFLSPEKSALPKKGKNDTKMKNRTRSPNIYFGSFVLWKWTHKNEDRKIVKQQEFYEQKQKVVFSARISDFLVNYYQKWSICSIPKMVYLQHTKNY